MKTKEEILDSKFKMESPGHDTKVFRHDALDAMEEYSELQYRELFHKCNEYQTKMQKLEREKNELLDLVEDTKNAYAWWIDEKGFKEPDKSDHEHYEKLIETLNKYGRTDH